jgi:hypothetical protein
LAQLYFSERYLLAYKVAEFPGEVREDISKGPFASRFFFVFMDKNSGPFISRLLHDLLL